MIIISLSMLEILSMCKTTTPSSASAEKSTGKFTRLDVSKHNKPRDCWVIYNNKVFNISSFNDHPGGDVIFTAGGSDMVEAFHAFHPPSAYKLLDNYCIGSLADAEPIAEPSPKLSIASDFRMLRSKIKSQGLYDASLSYYMWKIISNVGIAALSIYLTVSYAASSWIMLWLSSTIMGLFYQQNGWLAHDFLHHQVFKNRNLGNYFGYLVGNFFQAFSVEWWKKKHNTHHAIPNLLENVEGKGGDPDIDTMPILAWSISMGRKVKSMGLFPKFMIKHQAVLYFPILLVARLSWMIQSFWKTLDASIPNQSMEVFSLSLHYTVNAAVMYQSNMSLLQATVWWLWCQGSCGLMLALVFGLGHNGMEVFEQDKKPHWFQLQVLSTRNIVGNPLVHWFCGGLSYQIEHHLFPMVPRHNLPLIKVHVQEFCHRHGITYHETNMVDGTIEVLQFLDTVTKTLLEEFPGL